MARGGTSGDDSSPLPACLGTARFCGSWHCEVPQGIPLRSAPVLGLDSSPVSISDLGKTGVITETYVLLARRGEEPKGPSGSDRVSFPGTRSGLRVRSDSRVVLAGDSGAAP